MKRILRFTASWCGPCKSLAMNLESANLALPIEVVDIDIIETAKQQYNITTVTDEDKIKITKGYWDFDKTLLKYKLTCKAFK